MVSHTEDAAPSGSGRSLSSLVICARSRPRKRAPLGPWTPRTRRRRIPDVLETREALETKLAELAALRRPDDDLGLMEQALQAMKQAIERRENGAKEDGAIAGAARKPSLLT
jgi:DNA-binding FadR family transcriptional regulator